MKTHGAVVPLSRQANLRPDSRLKQAVCWTAPWSFFTSEFGRTPWSQNTTDAITMQGIFDVAAGGA